MRKRITLIGVLLGLLALCVSGQAVAGQPAGIWVTDLAADGTSTAGVAGESGASIFVIDTTALRGYSGNVMAQWNGVTLFVTGQWPPGFGSGISVYYANSIVNYAAGASPWNLVNWTLISATGGTVRSGNTYCAFDVAVDSAAPYVALKLVPSSGTTQWSFGLKAALSVKQ